MALRQRGAAAPRRETALYGDIKGATWRRARARAAPPPPPAGAARARACLLMRGALRPPSSGPCPAQRRARRARERRLRRRWPLASWRRPETALAGRRGRGAGRRGALPAGAGSDEPRERRSPSTTPRARTQVGEVVRGVGKVSLDVYNFLLKINGKYDLTDKAGAQLKDQLNKLKAGSSGETIAKVEDALSKATSKFNELDKEYDLVEKGKQASATPATSRPRPSTRASSSTPSTSSRTRSSPR